MRFPGVKQIRAQITYEQRQIRKVFSADELLDPNDADSSAGTEIRLQVYEDGSWTTHTGSSDYDQDHRGYWGSGWLLYGRQNLTNLTRDLLEQAKDQYAMEAN